MQRGTGLKSLCLPLMPISGAIASPLSEEVVLLEDVLDLFDRRGILNPGKPYRASRLFIEHSASSRNGACAVSGIVNR